MGKARILQTDGGIRESTCGYRKDLAYSGKDGRFKTKSGAKLLKELLVELKHQKLSFTVTTEYDENESAWFVVTW